MTNTTQKQSPLRGMKVALIGGFGAGKTHSIKTWLDSGITPHCVFTDPGFGPAVEDERVKYMYVPPASSGFDQFFHNAELISRMSSDQLAKTNMDKGQYTHFLDTVNACRNFVDKRTGENLGNAEDWNTDRVLVIDNLTGLSKMSRQLTVGARFSLTQPEWGIAMDNVDRFLDECLALRCHFLLISHVDRQRNELTGEVFKVMHTLGRKLAPILGDEFSDVILAQRRDTSFSWTTADNEMDLKANNTEWSETIQPTFAPMVEKWKRRGGLIVPTESENDQRT